MILELIEDMCPGTVIFATKFGSHLYGNDTKDSDLDYKAVYIPSYESLLLNDFPATIKYSSGDEHSKNTSDDLDLEIISIHKFLTLCHEGKMLGIDILYANTNPDCVICTSPIWDRLASQRTKFITQNIGGYLDYVKSQAHKYGIKGSKLSAMEAILDIGKSHTKSDKYRHSDKVSLILDQLPNDEFGNIAEINGAPGYVFLNKKFLGNGPLASFVDSIQKMYDKYGTRAHQAKDNEGIDWKAVSHAIRAGYQLMDLYANASFSFPRPEAERLRQIKCGELDFLNDVQPELEHFIDQMKIVAKECDYPIDSDEDFWREWLYENLYNFFEKSNLI